MQVVLRVQDTSGKSSGKYPLLHRHKRVAGVATDCCYIIQLSASFKLWLNGWVSEMQKKTWLGTAKNSIRICNGIIPSTKDGKFICKPIADIFPPLGANELAKSKKIQIWVFCVQIRSATRFTCIKKIQYGKDGKLKPRDTEVRSLTWPV